MNAHVGEPVRLLCVAPEEIPKYWHLARDLIDEGYAAVDELTPHDLPDWLEVGKGQLWLAVVGEKILAALTTSLVPMRNGLALKMVSCGGESLSIWKDCHLLIQEFARAEGCDRILSEGRPGWSRVFALDGYRVTRVTLEKRL